MSVEVSVAAAFSYLRSDDCHPRDRLPPLLIMGVAANAHFPTREKQENRPRQVCGSRSHPPLLGEARRVGSVATPLRDQGLKPQDESIQEAWRRLCRATDWRLNPRLRRRVRKSFVGEPHAPGQRNDHYEKRDESSNSGHTSHNPSSASSSLAEWEGALIGQG